jgi:hypothetical protein
MLPFRGPMSLVVVVGWIVGCGSPSDGSGDTDCASEAQIPYWADHDADGYGAAGSRMLACDRPDGFVANERDCDDADAAVHPGVEVEDECNGIDDNCDGTTDPDRPSWYFDADGDGYGDPKQLTAACEAPVNFVADGTDCDDSKAQVHPMAAEICDGLNNDCDDAIDEDYDGDGDGHAPLGACDAGDDCDDTDPTVFPGAAELCNDDIDNDCDGNKSTCLFLGSYDLEDATKRYADDANFDAGWRLEPADFDGDGKEDLAVSCYFANGYHGGAQVLPSPSSGTESFHDSGAFVAAGDTQNEGGRAIGTGDVNLDGYEDLLLGGPDSPGDDVALVLGPISSDTTWAAADWHAACDDYNECGHGLDLGDVNDDGFADAVVSAGEWDAGGIDAGALFVNFGPLTGDIALATESDAKLIGAEAHIETGRYVRAGEDIDGDGIGDLIATASYDNTGGASAGAVYMKLGPPAGSTDLATDSDGIYVGAAAYDSVGEGIALGDVDGDGKADVAAASVTADGGNGVAYIVYGPATGTVDLATAPGIIRGVFLERLGSAVAARKGQILIGAPGSSASGMGAGTTYLFIGPITGVMNSTAAVASFHGESNNDQSGTGVAFVDVDGDHFDEVAVGAPGDNTGGPLAGAVYVVSGD